MTGSTGAGPLRLVLLHSPLVGPEFWEPVAAALCASGLRTQAPRLPSLEFSYAPYWLAHAAGIANRLPDDGSVLLAAHSAAGVLLPAIGKLARNRSTSAAIAGYLFIDCDLPRDGASRLELWDDQAAAAQLRARAAAGFVPPFTDRALRELVPDEAQRAAFLASAPRVPFDVYDEPIMVPAEFAEARCGYLGLSAHYPSARAWAENAGWPNEQLDLHHFAPLTHVDAVAAAIAQLCAALTHR